MNSWQNGFFKKLKDNKAVSENDRNIAEVLHLARQNRQGEASDEDLDRIINLLLGQKQNQNPENGKTWKAGDWSFE